MRYQTVSANELFAAMRRGDKTIVRQLVWRDALVAASRDETGISAILHCLYSWDLSMLEILLAASPPLDVFEAAALGKVECLRDLLFDTPALACACAPDGVTALHLACFYGQHEVVECLLRAGADPSLRARNPQGSTPLQEAAATGQLRIILLLLAHGAELDLADYQGWTALHLAASAGYQDIVEALLLSGTASSRTPEGQTARDLALANGHLGTARVLDCLAET